MRRRVFGEGGRTAVAGGGGDGQQRPLSSTADGGGGEGAAAADVGVDRRRDGLSLREGCGGRVPGQSARSCLRLRNSLPGHGGGGARRLFPGLAAGLSRDSDGGGGERLSGQPESFQRPGTRSSVGWGLISSWF